MKRRFFLPLFAFLAFAAAGFFIATSAMAQTPVLSQTSVTVGLGQSVTVTAQGSAGVYMLSNSNSLAASVVTSGTQVTVTGMQLGSAALNICLVGYASNCTNLYVTVQAGTVSSLTLSPSNPSVGVGQTTSVGISGGSGYYLSGNTGPTVATTSISSSTLTVSGLASGSANITVCSAANGCGTTTVTVGSSSSGSQAVGFSVSNPTVAVGQSTTVTLSGGSTYYVLSNSAGSVAQATVSGNALTINGISAGTSLLTICVAGGDCSNLSVAVTHAAQTILPITTITSALTPVSTPTPAPALSSAGDIAALLAAIQSTQSQLAQILTQIQTMANTLTQLATKLGTITQSSGTSPVSSGVFSGAFTQYLGAGSENAEVTALQTKLTALGFYSGPVTGYFGSLTEVAVKDYQAARGISAVGFVGPSTRAALNAE